MSTSLRIRTAVILWLVVSSAIQPAAVQSRENCCSPPDQLHPGCWDCGCCTVGVGTAFCDCCASGEAVATRNEQHCCGGEEAGNPEKANASLAQVAPFDRSHGRIAGGCLCWRSRQPLSNSTPRPTAANESDDARPGLAPIVLSENCDHRDGASRADAGQHSPPAHFSQIFLSVWRI